MPLNFAKCCVSFLCVAAYIRKLLSPWTLLSIKWGASFWLFYLQQGQRCSWVTVKFVEGIKLLMLIHFTIFWADLIYYAATQSCNKQCWILGWEVLYHIWRTAKMPNCVLSLQTHFYFSVGCPQTNDIKTSIFPSCQRVFN